MHKFLEKIKKEIKELEEKPSLSMSEWQRIQMLTEIKKNILKIHMLEEGGGHSYDADESYERGYSERRMRDARGRYRSSYDGDGSYRGIYEGTYDGSYEGGSYRGSYGNDSYDGGRSGHEGSKEEMLHKLRGMMGSAGGKEKDALRRCIQQLESD
jgi:hypothetical protein